MIQKRNCKRCGPGILGTRCQTREGNNPSEDLSKELQDAQPQSGPRRLDRFLYYQLLLPSGKACLPPKPHSSGCRFSPHVHTVAPLLFGRNDIEFVPNGVDLSHFSSRQAPGIAGRHSPKLRYSPQDVVLLLVGNDLRNEGWSFLLDSLNRCRYLPLRLCVVGSDSSSDGVQVVGRLHLRDRVHLCRRNRGNPLFLCGCGHLCRAILGRFFQFSLRWKPWRGLPVVVSTKAGISDYLSNGVDSLLLYKSQKTQCHFARFFPPPGAGSNCVGILVKTRPKPRRACPGTATPERSTRFFPGTGIVSEQLGLSGGCETVSLLRWSSPSRPC